MLSSATTLLAHAFLIFVRELTRAFNVIDPPLSHAGDQGRAEVYMNIYYCRVA